MQAIDVTISSFTAGRIPNRARKWSRKKYTKLWTRHNDIARRNVECDSGCLDLLAGLLLPAFGLGREEFGGNVRNDTTLGDDNVSYSKT